MRICIPTLESNGTDARMSDHFGSAPYFTVYDTENRQVSTINNQNSEHAHGTCMPVDKLKEKKIDAVLCKGMGLRAVNMLLSAGIKPLLVEANTVADAITKHENGDVRIIDANLSCQHHECH